MKVTLPSLLLTLLLLSCQTTQAPIPADAPAEIYFQRAQAASELNQYTEALEIYRSFLTNQTDATPEEVFSARYEVALLLAKKGEIAQARQEFEALLADYQNLDKSAGAPTWVRILAEKKLRELEKAETKAAN